MRLCRPSTRKALVPLVAVAALTVSLTALSTSDANAVTGYKVVTGGPTLTVRSSPNSTVGNNIVGSLANNTPLDIACQAKGTTVVAPGGRHPTDVWDQLANGTWISDYWTNTPGLDGAWTAGIPQCGAGPVQSSTAAPVSKVPKDGCAAVRVMTARGSGEKFDDTQGMGRTVGQFVYTLQGKLRGVDVRFWADPYPATSVPHALKNGDETGVPYLNSVEYGRLFANSYLRSHMEGCPNERIILAGYSQGADVMHELWNSWIDADGWDKDLGRLVGVVLFADPHFDNRQVDSIEAYSLDIGSFRHDGRLARGGFLGRTPVDWSPVQERRYFMHSYCRWFDVVCDSGTSVQTHTTYPQVGIPGGAAVAAARWLQGHHYA